MRDAQKRADTEMKDVRAMTIGSGRLNLFGFIDGDISGGVGGGGVSYKHRVTKNLSAFLKGTAGLGFGDQHGAQYSGLAAVEVTF
jgi:hypothetical protein